VFAEQWSGEEGEGWWLGRSWMLDADCGGAEDRERVTSHTAGGDAPVIVQTCQLSSADITAAEFIFRLYYFACPHCIILFCKRFNLLIVELGDERSAS
jgi:hypothetical protein